MIQQLQFDAFAFTAGLARTSKSHGRTGAPTANGRGVTPGVLIVTMGQAGSLQSDFAPFSPPL